MRDYVVSLRVLLIVVLTALVLMSGTAFAGYFTMVPGGDIIMEYCWEGTLPLAYQVDDWDGYVWPATVDTIHSNDDPGFQRFVLTDKTRVSEIDYAVIQGVIAARGPVGGVGWIEIFVSKDAPDGNWWEFPLYDMYSGQLFVDTTGSEFSQLSLSRLYGDWTQEEIDDAEMLLVGSQPWYDNPPYRRGAVHVEEVRVTFSY